MRRLAFRYRHPRYLLNPGNLPADNLGIVVRNDTSAGTVWAEQRFYPTTPVAEPVGEGALAPGPPLHHFPPSCTLPGKCAPPMTVRPSSGFRT
jgi:hypothetical protein